MGLELRPNLKLPMHTSLFCFEGQRPLVERAGLHIGKSFHILSHLKTNWSDSLSIFFLFSCKFIVKSSLNFQDKYDNNAYGN